MSFSIFWSVLQQTIAEWQRDKVSRLAAALAYYTTFSLAPVLVIVIAVASFLFEQSTVQSRIINQLQGLLGENGAQLVQEMLTSAQANESDGFWATVISVGLLILGASGLFIQLQDALNTVWNLEIKPDAGLWRLIRDRLLSFGMILVIGFLLLVSLLLSAGLAAVSGLLGDTLFGWDLGWRILNAAVSFGVITLLFGLIYKILPDATISWRDVRVGAAMTALLFTLGKALIGLYLGNSSVASAYGAAGSFVVLLLWIYYSAQILLFGAEFTQVYANRFGSNIQPAKTAFFVDKVMPQGDQARPQGDLQGDSQGTEKAPAASDSSQPASRSEYKAQRAALRLSQRQRLHRKGQKPSAD
jgi:membrane protein